MLPESTWQPRQHSPVRGPTLPSAARYVAAARRALQRICTDAHEQHPRILIASDRARQSREPADGTTDSSGHEFKYTPPPRMPLSIYPSIACCPLCPTVAARRSRRTLLFPPTVPRAATCAPCDRELQPAFRIRRFEQRAEGSTAIISNSTSARDGPCVRLGSDVIVPVFHEHAHRFLLRFRALGASSARIQHLSAGTRR